MLIKKIKTLMNFQFSGRLYVIFRKGELNHFIDFNAKYVYQVRSGNLVGREALLDLAFADLKGLIKSYVQEPKDYSDEKIFISLQDFLQNYGQLMQKFHDNLSILTKLGVFDTIETSISTTINPNFDSLENVLINCEGSKLKKYLDLVDLVVNKRNKLYQSKHLNT
jgi:hypothetical protein